MKNKNLLVALSKLLKIDENVIIEASQKEDGDDSLIKDYLKEHQPYTASELSRLIENANKQYVEKADFDVNQVPSALYNKIKGAAMEKAEKELAKEYGIESYSSLKDLISKVSEKSKNDDGKGKPDETTLNQIEILKQAVQDKENELKTLAENYTQSEIQRELNLALKSLPLDYDEQALPKQIKLLQSAFGSDYKVEKKGESIIVLDSTGKLVADKLGDPLPISNVIKTFAESFGFKIKTEETGGRGQGSSDPKNSIIKGKSFNEVLVEREIKPLTNEADTLYKEWQAAQI